MLNNKKNSRESKSTIFYGWIIVFICALGCFFSGPGQTFSISMFVDSFISDFGMTRSLISTYYSVSTLLSGILVIIVSRQIDYFGHRKAITIISLIFGGVCLFMSFITGPFMLFIGFFLLRLLGQSSMTIGPSTLVPHWFETKRGKALGVMSVGEIVAAFAFPIMNIWLISSFGWRSAWRFWAINIWFVMVPLAWFFIRNRPKDIGLLSDGKIPDPVSDCKSSTGKTEHVAKNSSSMSPKQAAKTLTFWILLLSAFMFTMITTGIIFHIVSIFSSRGLSAHIAALVLSINAIVSFPSVLFAGFVSDRIKMHYVVVAMHILYFFTLIFLLKTQNLQQAIVFGLLSGIVSGFFRLIVNMAWPKYFGLRYLSSIRGIVQVCMVIGSALGPFIFAFAYDFSQGYEKVLWIMICFSAITAIATGFISPIKENQL